MGNGENKNKETLPEPGFVEQANALIEESYAVKIEDPKFGHGISPRDHQLLVKLMYLHEQHIYDILVDKFSGVVYEHYSPIMTAIEGIARDVASLEKNNKVEHGKITTWLNDLSKRQKSIEEKVMQDEREIEVINKRLDYKRKLLDIHTKRIDKIEKEVLKKEKEIVESIKRIDAEIHGDVPIKVGKTYKLERWVLAVLVAVFASTLITFGALYLHAKKVRAEHKQQIELEKKR